MRDNLDLFGKVLEHMIELAKAFLEDAGEFYPYAIIMDNNEEVRSLVVNLEDDHPPSNILIEEFEKHIFMGVREGTFLMGSLGVNTILNLNGEKTDAIEFRTFTKKNNKWNYVYLPYKCNMNGVQYGEITVF